MKKYKSKLNNHSINRPIDNQEPLGLEVLPVEGFHFNTITSQYNLILQLVNTKVAKYYIFMTIITYLGLSSSI